MNDKIKNKIEKIDNELKILKKGDPYAKFLAFDCIGILGNESTTESYENRLKIVEDRIKEYYKNLETKRKS